MARDEIRLLDYPTKTRNEKIIHERSQGLSLRQLAQKYHLTRQRVHQICERAFLRGELKEVVRACPHCGAHFQTNKAHKRYCSFDCMHQAQRRRRERCVLTRSCTICGRFFRAHHYRQRCPECAKKGLLRPKRLLDRACPQCGSEFQTYTRAKHYCSWRCYRQAAYRRKLEQLDLQKVSRTCPTCGSLFQTRKRNKFYCSASCARRAFYERRKGRRPVLTLTCRSCGSSFEALSKRRVYCSRACYLKANNKAGTERRRGPLWSRSCSHCGSRFQTYKSFRVYCSEVCQRQAHEQRDKEQRAAQRLLLRRTRLCLICGSRFQTHWKDSVYCSEPCRHEARLRRGRARYVAKKRALALDR